MNEPQLLPKIERPDDLYEELVRLTEGLNDQESLKAQARLVLLLANQIGNTDLLRELVRLARPDTVAHPGAAEK